jgi:hypothetical protein
MRSLWNFCRGAILFAALSLLTGCVTDPTPKKIADDPPPKNSATDSLTRQARQMRANSTDEEGTGLSDKSRDIERDLGFR